MRAPDEHEAILDAVERFCRGIPQDEVIRRDAAHIPPYDYIPRLAALGLTRAAVPERDGGLGLPWSLFCRIQERIGYHAQPIASILNRIVSFGILPLVEFGAIPRPTASRTGWCTTPCRNIRSAFPASPASTRSTACAACAS